MRPEQPDSSMRAAPDVHVVLPRPTNAAFLAYPLVIFCVLFGTIGILLGRWHVVGYLLILPPVLMVVATIRGRVGFRRAVRTFQSVSPVPPETRGIEGSAAIASEIPKLLQQFCWLSRTTTEGKEILGSKADAPPRIMVYGLLSPPVPGHYQFEPAIFQLAPLEPKRLLRVVGMGILFFMSLALLFMTVAKLSLGTWPWSISNLVRPVFLYVLPCVLVFAVLIRAWAMIARPKYLRLAPGMIQILTYKLRRQEPSVRSYPIDTGTQIVLCHERAWGDAGPPRFSLHIHYFQSSLLLCRAGQLDYVPLRGIKQMDDFLEYFWKAVLSTAPTPPLSEKELVG